MFNLFKKKKVESENIKQFKHAIDAINVFITLEDWDKARQGISEIKGKEKEGLEKLLNKLRREKAEDEKTKQIRSYNNKIHELEKLEKRVTEQKKKHDERIKKEKFKIRFNKIKNEIHVLMKTKRNSDALNLLSNFLEENKTNTSVIHFYNDEKKQILKNIERQRKLDEEKIKDNAKLEALKLIGQTLNEPQSEAAEKEGEKKWFLTKVLKKLQFYKRIQEEIRKKRLLDEVNILIEEDAETNKDIAKRKLQNIHKWLIKEISHTDILGYELYGKILGADKISGDTFGFVENDKKYNFFLWDATGHGIRAGLIVTLLSRIFNKFVKKSTLQELTLEINNGLKQDLKNRNFITGIFFEIKKEAIGEVEFVGMGHEPMLIYKSKEKKVERLIPWGLAAGIRLIKDKEHIKTQTIPLTDGDILVTYSDGVLETKNPDGQFYGIERLEQVFLKICQIESSINKIYNYVIEDLKLFRSGSSFDDDTTMLFLKRDENKDIISEDSGYIKDLSLQENLTKKDVKKFKGKTKEEIQEEIEKIKKERETRNILKILENLYYTGEILKLKQEAVRFIKAGFIHKKINFYLKKAIANETKYKIDQKNQKIQNKYTILKELYKKWDYHTVIEECEDIIAKDGNV